MRRSSATLGLMLIFGGVFAALAADAPASLRDAIAVWQGAPAMTRQTLTARIDAWNALPLAERQQARARHRAWRELGEAQRNRLRAAARAFHALPAGEQTRLRNLFLQQDTLRQNGWQLGPELGADWPRLQPLFGYLPAVERDASLRMLQQLDATQRDDLAALAQRVPPQSRDAFRRELLQVPPAQRAAWLHQQRSQ